MKIITVKHEVSPGLENVSSERFLGQRGLANTMHYAPKLTETGSA